jgi:amidase
MLCEQTIGRCGGLMMETGAVASDEELCWWPARRVAAAIAAGQLSAREYLDTLLTRIERHDPALGLVVTLDERAVGAARAADDATVRGAVLGPLHGVALTVKDSLATAGLRTTGGRPDLGSHVPREDATSVAALRRAGAIVFGKTNTPTNATDLQCHNTLFGVSRNPWQPEYTTGGSSGGSAGVVAAGFAPLELGTDVAGSIRIPASNCGVYGHKPSFGVVSTHGQVPPAPYRTTVADLAVTGPFARCLDDVESSLDLIAGPHPWDRAAWRLTLPPARTVRRVAVWFDDPYCPVDQEVRDTLEYAAEVLEDSGVLVEPSMVPGVPLPASDEIFRRLLAPMALANHKPDESGIEDGNSRHGAELGAEFVSQSYREWMAADDRRARLRMRWQRFFVDYDAILLPVAPNLALAHDLRPFPERRIRVNGSERPYWDQIVWAGLTGVSYLPTTVVPVRRDSRGVPIGIAIAGPFLEDRTTLAVARILAERLPPLGHPNLSEVNGALEQSPYAERRLFSSGSAK